MKPKLWSLIRQISQKKRLNLLKTTKLRFMLKGRSKKL